MITNRTSKGRGSARNSGWLNGSGEIVIFLDGDTLPSPDWIASYAAAFSDLRYDVVSGARYCLDIDPRQEDLIDQLARLANTTKNGLFREAVAEQFEHLHKHAALGPYPVEAFRDFDAQLRSVCEAYPENAVVGYSFVAANVAVRRSMLEAVNGFDEYLRRGEDTDLGIRLWAAAARFGFADGAKAYHQAKSTELQRSLSPEEAIGFFYRHPYKIVLLIYLWFQRQLDKSGETCGKPLWDLHTLVTKASAESDSDVNRELQRFVTSDSFYTEDQIIDYFVELFGTPEVLMRHFLSGAASKGLCVKTQHGVRLYPFYLTANWLRYQVPLHEYLLKNVSYFWLHKGELLHARRQQPAQITRCRGAYEIVVDCKSLGDLDLEAVLNVPLPVRCAAQDKVAFMRCNPPDLLAYADANRECIPRYPWSEGSSSIRLSYEFECEVHERLDGMAIEEEMSGVWLRPALKAAEYPKAKAIIKGLDLDATMSAEESARRIYNWIHKCTKFYEVAPEHANIWDTGIGACIDQARVFINLCRLARIPAREQCGALLTRRADTANERFAEVRTIYYSPFAHTWAEYHVNGRGWLPVEFCNWGYGARCMTPCNVESGDLRKEITATTDECDEYYFGNLDPYRIHASARSNRTHVSLKMRDDRNVEKARSATLVGWEMRRCIKHVLRCQIL
jgi:hypothetical protein